MPWYKLRMEAQVPTNGKIGNSMSFPEYEELDGLGLAELIRAKEITPGEIIEEAMRRAEALNPELNFLSFDAFDEGRRMAADTALPWKDRKPAMLR